MRIAAAIFAFSLCAAAQQPGGIFGRVTNAETHEPVRRAIVKIYTPKQQWDEFTDAEGRFKFPQLPRAEYALITHREGYTERSYKIELSDFDNPKELSIELNPQGVITGRVTNSAGLPLANAHIQAGTSQAGASTNDLGEYRLSELDPGAYTVSARYQEGRQHELDSTPLKLATASLGGVTVKSGETVSGVNFALDAAKPLRIRGALRNDGGAFNDSVMLFASGPSGMASGDGRDGQFEVRDVVPGTYSIAAHTSTRDRGSPFWGSAVVKVGDAEVEGVEILMKPSPKIEGRIQTEGTLSADQKPRWVFFNAVFRTGEPTMTSATPDADGNFTTFLVPGEYIISFDSSHTQVVSATLDGSPIRAWRVTMTEAAETKKLVIVVKQKAAQ